jgi:lysyl-tRNA synthetase, class II
MNRYSIRTAATDTARCGVIDSCQISDDKLKLSFDTLLQFCESWVDNDVGAMTSVRYLRLPCRLLASRTTARSFHLWRQDGTNRLRSAVGETEGRSTAVAEPETKEPESEQTQSLRVIRKEYPRLVHRARPMSVPRFREKYENIQRETINLDEVTVYGRVTSIRRHGAKLMFIDIVNEFERVQAMVVWGNCSKTPGLTMGKFKMFARLIERGDHISVTGHATQSSTGALTIQATHLPELVAPTSEPIPEKLVDPETRMQHRHVDMLVNQETTDILRLRSHITKYMRDYFHSQSFLEFQTPILGENAGGAIARPFTTRSTEFPSKELSLRIAPELWLKRLVIGGVDKVFEIGPAFRNEGIDSTHNPEFTMCEFYSAYSNLPDLINQTEEILVGLAHHCQELISTSLTSLQPIDITKFARPFRHLEFIPALEDALGLRLPKLSGEDAYSELLALLTVARVDLPGGPPPNMVKLLDTLAAIYLEPQSFRGPLFITHHPSCMSPLAKSFLCPTTFQLVSARTELFVNGRELANMYEEENDPAAQAKKLAEHRKLGKSAEDIEIEEKRIEAEELGEEGHEVEAAPLDRSYIRAMEAGLPPTGGWGCGVERLVMLFSGANRISDCLSFGSLKNVVGLTSGMKVADREPEAAPARRIEVADELHAHDAKHPAQKEEVSGAL